MSSYATKRARGVIKAVASILVTTLVVMGAVTPASAGGGARWIEAQTLAAPEPTVSPGRTRFEPASSCPDRLPRATVDRPDRVSGRTVHVVYLVPADFPDEGLDRSGTIECSVRSWSQWFVEASGGHQLRLDTFAAKIGRRTVDLADVTFVRTPTTGSELGDSGAIEEALVQAGLDDPEKLYLSYVAADAGTLCGSGRYPIADVTDPSDPFAGHGRFAQVFLFSDDGCHPHEFGVPGTPRWVEATAMQEMLHTEGVTPIGAPHACTGLEPIPTHVCTPGLGHAETASGVQLDPERVDVMFPFASLPLSEKVLDRGRDDYFLHGLPWRDLAKSPYVDRTRAS